MKICAIVPAFNERERIGAVLDALVGTSCISEVVVVDDGSSDDTAAVAAAHPTAPEQPLRVIRLDRNEGKGAAMRHGADATDAEALVFFDADLIGLTPEQVEAVVAPVAEGRVPMTLGVFRGGRGATDLSQILVPNITGQRAILRELFQSIPCLSRSGYGVELAITNYVTSAGLKIERVPLIGVTHTMKEEKLGFIPGLIARCRMYWQMLPYFIRQRPRRPR